MRRLKVTTKDKNGRNTFMGKKEQLPHRYLVSGKKERITHCPACGEKLPSPARPDSLVICFKKKHTDTEHQITDDEWRCEAKLDDFQCKKRKNHEGMHEIRIFFNTPRHPWI